MTVEEKAKAYDEALERAKNFVENGDEGERTIAESIFDGIMEEPEDELLMKELINAFKEATDSLYMVLIPSKREAFIAWLEKQGNLVKHYEDKLDKCACDYFNKGYKKALEKQGEQKFEQKFFINDKVVHKATGKIWTIHYYLKDTNSYYVEDNDGLLHHYIESELKLVEKKPAEWSEEDEKCLKELTQFFENLLDCVATEERHKENRRWLNWFKSLSPQSHWKPSKEQMDGLKEAIEFLGCTKTRREQLQSLYEQLNKLREE